MKLDHVDGQGDLIRSAFLYDLLLAILTFGRERSFRQNTLEMAKIGPGDRVLDVGCGTGTLAIAAKRLVGPDGAVSGVDASAEMIARAKAKAARQGLAVTFEVGTAQKLPFADAAFDVVLSSLMLHHVPEPTRKDALMEMRRVLKPAGRLLVVELTQKPSLMSSLIPARLRHSHEHAHAYVEAKALMKDAGFNELGSGSFWRFAGWVLGQASPNHA